MRRRSQGGICTQEGGRDGRPVGKGTVRVTNSAGGAQDKHCSRTRGTPQCRRGRTDRLGLEGSVPHDRSRRTVCPRRGPAQGGSDLSALPGDAGVCGRRAGQQGRVRSLGRHDRAATPRVAQAAPRGGVLGGLLRQEQKPHRRLTFRRSANRPPRCRRAAYATEVIWSARARNASKSETSKGSDGTPTTGTCGLAPVNRESNLTSRLAVWARSA